MSDALRSGNIGVMDLVRYRNVESDTAMRRSLSGETDADRSKDPE